MHIPVRHLEITGAPSCAAFDVSLREGASIVVPGILPRRISGPRIASSADLGLGEWPTRTANSTTGLQYSTVRACAACYPTKFA
jgi:hypothetical protein